MSDYNPDDDAILATIGTVTGESYDILLTVRAYKGGTPSLRINRVGEKKDKENKGKMVTFTSQLGSLRSPAEIDGLAKLLPAASKALAKALAAWTSPARATKDAAGTVVTP